MSAFSELFEYNRWANSLVLEATAQMSAEALAAPMPELGGSTLGLLEHLAQVQANFLGIMTGAGRPPRDEGRGFDQIAALVRSTDDGFLAALPALEARLQDQFELPWFGRSFTVEQGLTQVATHSVQHRAGISAGIARSGLKPADLDYIIWCAENR